MFIAVQLLSRAIPTFSVFEVCLAAKVDGIDSMDNGKRIDIPVEVNGDCAMGQMDTHSDRFGRVERRSVILQTQDITDLLITFGL